MTVTNIPKKWIFQPFAKQEQVISFTHSDSVYPVIPFRRLKKCSSTFYGWDYPLTNLPRWLLVSVHRIY